MAENVSSQLLKGVLQGIMLVILAKKPNYGYGITKEMNDYGLLAIPKGTIYPLLTSMTNKGLLLTEMHTAESGRDRKYYYITEAGLVEKAKFISEWHELVGIVGGVVKGELYDENQ